MLPTKYDITNMFSQKTEYTRYDQFWTRKIQSVFTCSGPEEHISQVDEIEAVV